MPNCAVKTFRVKALPLLILLMLVGCNFPALQTPVLLSPLVTSETEFQQTLVTFNAHISEPLPAGDSIYLSLLDEVTGLSFNSHKYVMNASDPLNYTVTLPFTIGKVIKYRYTRQGANDVDEHLYNNRPVRYRLYNVTGPATVEDMVSQWTDTEYLGPRGRIMGRVFDFTTGKPIPSLLVTAGGEQALTLADGSFLLEGLPPGTHTLVFYALDGMYDIFQQGAVVAADSTTPVDVQLSPARLVTVIFTVKVPADTPPDAPLRLAGSLYQLGNSYADLSGGVSTLASRMLQMGKLSDGMYMLTLSLPSGAYIEYKYTLGDGLWSSEVNSKGEFRLRQVIIPDNNLEQNDVVDSWHSNTTSPIRFEVKVPEDTPQDETISIQFNPGFGWLEPISMWPATNAQGEKVWRFDLTGPFNDLASMHYRYCRQDQCGSADDAETIGSNPIGRVIDLSPNTSTITDEVSSWAWLSSVGEAANVYNIQASPRSAGFIAGIAFQPGYHLSWGPILPNAIGQVKSLNVNWLILTPTWTWTNSSPPILEPLPSQDMLWQELTGAINNTSRTPQFTIGLYPIPLFPVEIDQWWRDAPRDFAWWMSFFERYTNFIMHHAIVASNGAEPLILGGSWLNPALPNGALSDGTPSNVPQDAEERWRNLIQLIRLRYSGEVGWMLTYPDGIKNPPPFLDVFDQVYILWSASLATQPGVSVEEMQAQAGAILDQEILPFQQATGKPVIIAISYPSIDQSATGCIQLLVGGCLDYDLLKASNPDITELGLNLQAQANAYHAMLSAINERSWVSGFISMGYYPPAILQDKSISIHGKPAGGVVWFWSAKFLGR